MSNVLLDRLAAFRSNVIAVKSRCEYEEQNVQRLRDKVAQIEQDKIQLVKALGLIDKTITVISANGIGKIESIVTAGLRLVFKDPGMAFVVEKKETANRGNAYRLLVRKGGVTAPPMENFGGGVTNVISFLLRVILIKRFKLAKFLIVDESFNNVNGIENQLRVSEMMTKLCNDHGYTILAVTGQKIFAQAAKHIYRVSANEEGTSVLWEEDPEEFQSNLDLAPVQ